MRKKLIGILFTVIVITVAGYNVYASSQRSEMTLSDFTLTEVEALTSSERGCISQTGKNNGDCETDGSHYFCANSIWIDDCVKGVYP